MNRILTFGFQTYHSSLSAHSTRFHTFLLKPAKKKLKDRKRGATVLSIRNPDVLPVSCSAVALYFAFGWMTLAGVLTFYHCFLFSQKTIVAIEESIVAFYYIIRKLK